MIRHVDGADHDGAREAHRNRRRSNGRDANLCERRHVANERQRTEPGDGTGGRSNSPYRDVEERSHDGGVEVSPGARQEFGASGLRRHRRLVTAKSGHNVVSVGDGDNARAERYLLAGQSFRVAGAVVLLVVLGHRVGPLAKPSRQRSRQFSHPPKGDS